LDREALKRLQIIKINKMAIKGLAGNEMAQPRVFAHDALDLNLTAKYTYNTDIPGTQDRGVCLYAGVDITSIEVVMESGTQVIFKGISAGSFLPVLVTKVVGMPSGATANTAGELLALY